MIKKMLGVAAAAVMFVGSSQSAGAVELSVQEVLNDITIGGVSSINVATEKVVPDDLWSIGASGASVATIVIEIAGWAGENTFGIYDPYLGGTVEIFSGAQSAGNQTSIGIDFLGNVYKNFSDTGVNFAGNIFGYYFGTSDGTWYSDTTKNSDGYDHMWAFQGEGDTIQIDPWAAGVWASNEYILAWEDRAKAFTDGDHNDMMLLVESVTPVPEPGTMLLLGSGLLGLGLMRRKKAIKK